MRAPGWSIGIPLLALLLVPLARAIVCPPRCFACTASMVECPQLTIVRKNTHLDVRCTDWDAYDFGDLDTVNSPLELGPYDQLSFVNCAIPQNRSLADTLAFLGPLSNVSQLFFLNNSRHRKSAPLAPILFEGLGALTILSLKNATRHPITAPDLFIHLPQLRWLDLREYGGDSVPADLLRPLQALRTLELRQNLKLEQLPPGWFSHLPQLTDAIVYGNGLRTVPRFDGTPLLAHLDLSGNQLETLPANLFTELPKLTSLDLKKNRLTALPRDIFGANRQLVELDLSHNGLEELPDSLLQDQRNLKTLYLNYNNLTSLNTQVLRNLNVLQKLHIDHNRLRAIDVNAFEGQADTLSELLLNHNNISFYERHGDVMYQDGKAVWGFQTPFQHLNNVMHLNLSHNAIVKVFDDFHSFMASLRVLDLSHNSIRRLEYDQLNFISNKVELLDLSGNQIRDIQMSRVPVPISRLPQKIVLNENPLRCDCDAHAFVNFLQRRSVTPTPFVTDRLTCDSPVELHGKGVRDVSPLALVCDHRGDVCPPECSCQIRPEDRVVIVDCSSRNLTHLPALRSPTAIDYRSVDLRLQNNLLVMLPDRAVRAGFGNESTASAWEAVYRLNVSNNRLTAVVSSNLPPRLEMLDVSGNQLKAIDAELARKLKHVRSVGLAGNPWTCECSAELLGFVQTNSSRITDFESMRCDSKQNITVNLQHELCSVYLSPIVWISVTVAVLALVVALLGVLYHKYQHEVKVWLFTHNLLQWLTSEEEVDKDKLYDAFVSYSHKDEAFITEHLVPTLERAPMNFRICWHVRDFMPGEMISSQITKAVEESRRTIIVLSANYLESVWGQMEFKTAYLQSIEDKRNRVIAIIYDDIGNVEDLDQELRAYLKTNTYLRWGDPWFWDKLRYAMPHPRQGTQITNNMRLASMDKLNLIKSIQNGVGGPAAGSDSPTQESTPPIEQVAKGTDSSEGPLTKLYAPAATAPLFTISSIKLDLNMPN
uniref:TIR domain-containing protein n=1 Tax=Anopheles atroparvus TaxID=41427 RepID=A0AAG5DWX7_ANOAO